MAQGFTGLDPAGLLVRTRDGRNCRLEEPLGYETKSGLRLRLPIMSSTDGRSSPRGTWNVVPPFGKGWLAWVFHDGCYRNTVEMLCVDGQWRAFNPTKQQSDDLLQEIMEFLQCDLEETVVTFQAVKQFGEASFKEDRRAVMPGV